MITEAHYMAAAFALGLVEKFKAGQPPAPHDIIAISTAVAAMATAAVKPPQYSYHPDGESPGGDEYFCFGSNRAGIHGAGAAAHAARAFGAQVGVGRGFTGRAVAIPTKDERIISLTLSEIAVEVAGFVATATVNPDKRFWMTRVGCGLAGYKDRDIAPLFIGSPDNVIFPEEWRSFLNPVSTDSVEAWLRRKYVTRADDRQAELGLSYVEAETKDLAKEIFSTWVE